MRQEKYTKEAEDNICLVIGFVGSEKYDMILYLSRILYHLGGRVLVMDMNESGAISSCIPKANIITEVDYIRKDEHGEEFIEDRYVDYRGVHYVCEDIIQERTKRGFREEDADAVVAPMNQYITQIKHNYDVILIDLGFFYANHFVAFCDKLFLTTDQQKHNIGRILAIKGIKEKETYAIFKDFCTCKITDKVVRREFSFILEDRNIFTIYKDEIDDKNKIYCQYNAAINFSNISSSFSEVLLKLIEILCPGFNKKEISQAYGKAKKGV